MKKLQSPEYAKQNIIDNYKANYDMEHSSANEGDVEIFITNALSQFEDIVRADCQYDRDKQDEAVKNLERDYIKNIIRERIKKIEDRLQSIEATEGELGVIQGYKNVINLIDGKL
jgi:hypothetical protein